MTDTRLRSDQKLARKYFPFPCPSFLPALQRQWRRRRNVKHVQRPVPKWPAYLCKRPRTFTFRPRRGRSAGIRAEQENGALHGGSYGILPCKDNHGWWCRYVTRPPVYPVHLLLPCTHDYTCQDWASAPSSHSCLRPLRTKTRCCDNKPK